MSLRWEYSMLNGTIQAVPQTVGSPSLLLGRQPKDSAILDKVNLINKNGLRFFSSFGADSFVQNAHRMANDPSLGSGRDDSHGYEINAAIASQKSNLYSRVSDVAVSVDGVFFNDGTFVGEDKNFSFDQMRGYAQANKDFARKVNDLKAVSAKNSTLLDELVSDLPDAPFRLSKSEKVDVGVMNLNNSFEAFEFGYRMKSSEIKREITFKRSRGSDLSVVNAVMTARVSDEVVLRKNKQ